MRTSSRLILCGALALASAAPAAAAARPRNCVPHGGRTLAADRVVRVYETGPTGSSRRNVAACVLGKTGHMTLLAAPSPRYRGLHQSVGNFHLAGSIVAYRETQFGVDSGTTWLVVADVASRLFLHTIAPGQYVDAGFVLSEGVTEFVVSTRGGVAWISESTRGRTLIQRSVHEAARTGAEALLDEGTAIDPTSLRLSGGVLAWLDGGVRRTAAMP